MCLCLMTQYEVMLALVLKLAHILGHSVMLVFLWLETDESPLLTLLLGLCECTVVLCYYFIGRKYEYIEYEQ